MEVEEEEQEEVYEKVSEKKGNLSTVIDQLGGTFFFLPL